MFDDTGIDRRAISRRRFLQGGAVAGFGAFLAACSGSSAATSAPPVASTAASIAIPTPPPVTPGPTVAATPKVVTGPLHWAQWPAYIDLAGKAATAGKYSPGSSPTLEEFKKKYSVDVNYEEKIDANDSFFATIQPQLVAGAPTGWDMITITDWLAAKIISKGWAEKIDQSNVPNCVANLRDPLRNQTWDPGNDYHYPWQSGMTGIGYDKTSLTKNNMPFPKSLADLWALPANKVTFLNEKRDTFGLGLLKLGKSADPAMTTDADLQAVHDDIKPLVGKGLRFTGNSYLQDFAAKTTWAAMTWSGDLASSGSADQVWVAPTEGSMVWSDNMVIPKGATNIYTAELMMNFVYDPKIAAQIADFVFYVSPVKGAAAEIAKIDPPAAKNPLLFPPAAVVAGQHNWQFLSDELEAKLNQLYSDLSGT
ncbi:MAG: polyamine ABC transporter substrate-binding protein [Candidatus Limnocylindrales bacterium]